MFRPVIFSCVLALLDLSARGDVIVVCPDGSGDFTTIQSAIGAAGSGDQIQICPGIYPEVINLLGKPITLFSTESAETTIVDGSGLGAPVVQCVSGETEATAIRGLTISGGRASMGGGIRVVRSSPSIAYCVIADNESSDEGGGIYCDAGSPTITDCIIARNRSNGGGGAILQSASNPTVLRCEIRENEAMGGTGGGVSYSGGSGGRIEQCLISNNRADLSGGGIRCLGSSPLIFGCIVRENHSDFEGGGLSNEGSSPSMVFCDIVRNSSVRDGGGMHNVHGSNPSIEKCRFLSNHSQDHGGGMDCHYASSPVVVNCLFLGNDASTGGGGLFCNEGCSPVLVGCTLASNLNYGIMFFEGRLRLSSSVLSENEGASIYADANETVVSYSNVQGGWPGEGNIDADPLFVDPDNGSYRLRPGSPCIDAGDNTAVPDGVETDLDGLPRFICDATSAHAGNGDAPLVDMGAHERQISAGECGSQVSSFDVKYKDRIQGLRIKACLADGTCESVGAGWRLTFAVYNGVWQERARVTRNSGCAVAKFPGLVCGDTYECSLSQVQNSSGEDCTPTTRPSEPAIIACLQP